MQRSQDEPFTLYGLLAESVEWDEDRSFIQYNLNPAARWSDGVAGDRRRCDFHHGAAPRQGAPALFDPSHRVEKMEKISDLSVRFTFNETVQPGVSANLVDVSGASKTCHRCRDL
jgi:peptide/nickel transport system substrate-binding protein